MKDCAQCNIAFSPSQRHQKYCSYSCRKKAENRRFRGVPQYESLTGCLCCGKVLQLDDRRKMRRYCDDKCRDNARPKTEQRLEIERAAKKRWEENNPEKRREVLRRWYRDNYPRIKEKLKQYAQKHRERYNALNRGYREKFKQEHPEEYRRKRVESYRKNPQKYLARHHLYETRMAGGGGSYTSDEWDALLERTGRICLRCKKGDVKLTVDHVIPVSKGGTSNIDNIQPLCLPCNSRKHAKIVDYRQGSDGEKAG